MACNQVAGVGSYFWDFISEVIRGSETAYPTIFMDSSHDSITVAIAALNEETHLKGAVETVLRAVSRHFESFEIIIFNDGSTDGTGRIADTLAECHQQVTVVHHERPKCLGGVIRSGLSRARMKRFMWVDGKGATTEAALDAIFSLRDKADLVVPYPCNQHERALRRRIISRAFVTLVGMLFRTDLKYYTHVALFHTAQARQFSVRTDSYAYQAEALIKMIRAGHTYVQVGVEDCYSQEDGQTKAFKLNNVTGIATFLLGTLWDVYVVRGFRRSANGAKNSVTAPQPVSLEERSG